MDQTDVMILRFLTMAMTQGYRVVSDVATRQVHLVASSGEMVSFADVSVARAFLRVHLWCGSYARRCDHVACWVRG